MITASKISQDKERDKEKKMKLNSLGCPETPAENILCNVNLSLLR